MQPLHSTRMLDKNTTPESVILQLYDLGIECCQKKEQNKATKVLTELINALNFEHGEMSILFCKLYQYAISMVHIENYDQSIYVLKEMRNTWEQSVILKE